MNKIIILIFISLKINTGNAQTLNWASIKENQKHFFNAHIGLDFGINYGLRYGYTISNKYIPMMANVELSVPAGDKFLDDFKSKIGINIKWFTSGNFLVSSSIQGVFRRFENDYVRLTNFGSDMKGVIGFYRSRWFIAGEFGFDKAIVTHFKHSRFYSDQYPSVVNGWYEPSTGGNFNYGLQSGFTFYSYDLYFKAGNMLSQDFKTAPLLPFYAEFGFNKKF